MVIKAKVNTILAQDKGLYYIKDNIMHFGGWGEDLISDVTYYHLFFTTTEKPRIDDWCYHIKGVSPIMKCKFIDSGHGIKVVASTDPMLIKLGVPKINLFFVRNFVKRSGKIKSVNLNYKIINDELYPVLWDNQIIIL
jgi:hypothetical protein